MWKSCRHETYIWTDIDRHTGRTQKLIMTDIQANWQMMASMWIVEIYARFELELDNRNKSRRFFQDKLRSDRIRKSWPKLVLWLDQHFILNSVHQVSKWTCDSCRWLYPLHFLLFSSFAMLEVYSLSSFFYAHHNWSLLYVSYAYLNAHESYDKRFPILPFRSILPSVLVYLRRLKLLCSWGLYVYRHQKT